MKKLQAVIQEGTQTFDELLLQLFLNKVQAELAVFQVSSRQLYTPSYLVIIIVVSRIPRVSFTKGSEILRLGLRA